MHRIKRLFWDVEITPNLGFFWKPGFKVSINPEAIVSERRLICIGWKWEGEKMAHVLKCDGDGNDKEMLKDFLSIAEMADELVAHFGDKADMPWMKARCLIHGFSPLPIFKTSDTCSIAEKNYGFNSGKLDYLASVLGYGHKSKTEFSMWAKISLRASGWKSDLERMARYCAKDVILLEKVWSRIRFCQDGIKTHAGVSAGLPRWTCPHCASEHVRRRKIVITPKGILTHQFSCNACKGYFKTSDLVYRQFTSRHANREKGPETPSRRQAPPAAARLTKGAGANPRR